MLFKASSPGSLMLLGEYAVLHGQHALVAAIDKRMTVTLSPRTDKKIILTSELGRHETHVGHLISVAPFQFVLSALRAVKKHLKHGCEIKIESEFSATVGFASSAAVTVATLSALTTWLQLSLSSEELIKLGRRVVQSVQGVGSGADIAACVLGGMVLYRMKPFYFDKLSQTHPITVIYSGNKTPTTEAIAIVKKKFEKCPQLFRQLGLAINECTLEGVAAIKQQDWRALGQVMNMQQGLMDAMGVNTVAMNQIIEWLRAQPHMLGAKISGSGLGDCVIGLGSAVTNAFKQIDVNIAPQGVSCEKI